MIPPPQSLSSDQAPKHQIMSLQARMSLLLTSPVFTTEHYGTTLLLDKFSYPLSLD
jgi:hypothetical protein